MTLHNQHDQQHGTEVLLAPSEVQLKPPQRYAVWLLNDDYTPMEFVVSIICQVFNASEEQAIAIMLKVHHEGKAVCGVYTKDIAQTRVAQVLALAQEFQHPLQCIAQPEDSET